MQGRERKIVRAALRGSHDALAEIEPIAQGERPATALSLARAIRTLLEGQIALLEALGGGGGPLDSDDGRNAENAACSPAKATAVQHSAISAFDPSSESSATPPSASTGPQPVHADVAAQALRAFELEPLNRWVASGTVFQIRGALAFLNMNSMGGGKVDEMSGHIRKMGFTELLGRLEAEGVSGAILLFRKPE